MCIVIYLIYSTIFLNTAQNKLKEEHVGCNVSFAALG